MSHAPETAQSKTPAIGVGMVIWRGEEVLLVKRAKAPLKDQWSIPGGSLEWGESPAEGALREVREETGLEVELLGLIDVVDARPRGEDGEVLFHLVLIDYAALWIAGEPLAASDAAEVRWQPWQDLAELKLWSETVRIIEQSRRLLA